MSRAELPGAPPEPDLSRRLASMRFAATALLAAMAVLFVATSWLQPRYPALGWLRACAEAALMGGLADWFAVTALFRRPLGLPIPHTAVVPSRKDAIGRALARFIRDHFLVRETIERRLARGNVAARVGHWLMDEENAERLGVARLTNSTRGSGQDRQRFAETAAHHQRLRHPPIRGGTVDRRPIEHRTEGGVGFVKPSGPGERLSAIELVLSL
jgi:hypothetical protein